jgi:peptidyl-prolyl cis-trans isomerase SurA
MIPVSPRFFAIAAMLIGLAPTALGQAAAENPAPRVEKPAPSASEVDGAIADEIATRFQSDRTKFLSFLREQGKTMREYRRETEARLSRAGAVSPTVAEAKDERVHLRLIQLNRREAETDDQLLARGKEVMAKIKAGEAFADVAKVQSDDLKRAHGGDWGWLKRTDFRTDFASVAFGLKKGEVSEPILKPEGCFLLFVEDRR